MIEFYKPSIGKEEVRAVQRVIKGKYLAYGPEVSALERKIAEMCNVNYAVAVSSCTAGLYICMKYLKPTYVNVTANTFVATIQAIIEAGHTPVLCDTYRDYSVNRREDSMAVVVRYNGIRDRGVLGTDIEDLAHSTVGTSLEGRAGVFSFYGNKKIGCGEGGAIITNDKVLSDFAKVYRGHGREVTEEGKDCIGHGFNFKMTDIQAAILNEQIKKLPEISYQHMRSFDYYYDNIKNDLVIPDPYMQNTSCHIFSVLLPNIEYRKSFMAYMQKNQIEVTKHYIPIYRLQYFQNMVDYDYEQFPVCEMLYQKQVSLPIYPGVNCKKVVEVINRFGETNV